MCSARAVQEKQWQKWFILGLVFLLLGWGGAFGALQTVQGVEKSCVGLANNPTQRQLLRFDAADESAFGGFLLAAGFGFVFGCGFALGAGGLVFGGLVGFWLAAVAVVIVAWVGTAGALVAVCGYL